MFSVTCISHDILQFRKLAQDVHYHLGDIDEVTQYTISILTLSPQYTINILTLSPQYTISILTLSPLYTTIGH